MLDTSLLVKKSLTILTQNGKPSRAPGHQEQLLIPRFAGIVSAPLWDSSTSSFGGLLTTADYINVIQYYHQYPDKLAEVDNFRLTSLRGESRRD
jgi:5'-AMP-activated protein kinase regulatory gamma subunit